MPNTDSNGYTFFYATVMTLLVAVSLATVATGLKPMQDIEIALAKKQAILNSVSPVEDKTLVDAEYAKRIEPLVIDASGAPVQGANAFDIDIRKEYKKDPKDRQLPLYIYKFDDGKKSYIMPLHGAGLWDAIWGYVALESDFNTIMGTAFDHKGETPGLGAEITKPWFQGQFIGKKLTDEQGGYAFDILKGRGNNIDGKAHVVDGMSGATITGDGVEVMLEKGYGSYQAYFKTLGS